MAVWRSSCAVMQVRYWLTGCTCQRSSYVLFLNVYFNVIYLGVQGTSLSASHCPSSLPGSRLYPVQGHRYWRRLVIPIRVASLFACSKQIVLLHHDGGQLRWLLGTLRQVRVLKMQPECRSIILNSYTYKGIYIAYS